MRGRKTRTDQPIHITLLPSVGLRVLKMASLKGGSAGVEKEWLLGVAALRDFWLAS